MSRVTLATTVELLKPVTWFPPMWALMCGVVSSGVSITSNWVVVVGGVMLAGPLVCGTSQAVNDWFDREVDKINEPSRPIPSGRMPGRSGLYVAIVWSLVSLLVAWALGIWVLVAGIIGLILAWAYSAPPVRLKNNGWLGNTACAACYEGLPWFTGVAMLTAGFPDERVICIASCYSLGAIGIMTVNDFKSVEGDTQVGIRSVPVQLGIPMAARVSAGIMIAAQLAVIWALWSWNLQPYALAVAALTLGQAALAPKWFAEPEKRAAWFNGTAILLYVIGMLISSFAIRP